MCVTLTVASAIAGIGGTAYSIDRQREAQKDNERAARIEKRKAAIQNARERRRAAAEAQVMRSRIQASQAAGGFESTGQDTAMGAINAQLGGNLSFSSLSEAMNNRILSAQTSAGRAQTQAGYGQAAAALPGQLGFGLGSMIQKNKEMGLNWYGGTPSTSQGTGFGGMSMPKSPFLQGYNSTGMMS